MTDSFQPMWQPPVEEWEQSEDSIDHGQSLRELELPRRDALAATSGLLLSLLGLAGAQSALTGPGDALLSTAEAAGMPSPLYTPPGGGARYIFTSELITFLVRSAAFTVFEDACQQGYPGPPPHIHLRQDEGFYVLQGTMMFRGGPNLSKKIVTTAGGYVHIPRGTLHTWGNAGRGIGRVLTIFSPPGDFERLVEAVGTPTNSKVPPRPGNPTQGQINAIGVNARKNFIVFPPRPKPQPKQKKG